MRLITLGGAAAWPNPGQGCSSYLVSGDDWKILLDCGPDTLLELRKHTHLSDLDAILISHCHADHILDLIALRYALHYGPEGKRNGSFPLTIFLPPGGNTILNNLADALSGQGETGEDFWTPWLELCEYDPGSSISIGNVQIQFHRNQHFMPCWAMRLSDGSGRDLVYGADTGAVQGLDSFASGAKALIAESTVRDHVGVDPDERGHLTPADTGRLAQTAGVDALIVSHLWSERPDSEVTDEIRKIFNGFIAVAKPGATFDV